MPRETVKPATRRKRMQEGRTARAGTLPVWGGRLTWGMSNATRRAIFLDRDGTLNLDTGYVRRAGRAVLLRSGWGGREAAEARESVLQVPVMPDLAAACAYILARGA